MRILSCVNWEAFFPDGTTQRCSKKKKKIKNQNINWILLHCVSHSAWMLTIKFSLVDIYLKHSDKNKSIWHHQESLMHMIEWF